ncbi:MAG TPA: DUF3857 and transglutaminase domain-containing protein [Verrucomicrobiae bacterium]|nr:DUF3857 and transglutaminase domain-containing protein [Verrucomicrobiae bacterium]
MENATISAKSRVRSGAYPDWSSSSDFDENFKASNGAQITYLLIDNQVHAERHELFVRQVIRLETMEAVQHWSQWKLQFEPKQQLITLHSLKIRRGQNEIEQSNLEKAHFLQREEGLERFVIHGWFTLLMILEDVRPGDVLDFAYTIESSSELFPNQGGSFFILPQGMSVGKYRFAVQFADARQRKWRSSANLLPTERHENGMTFWEWSGEKFVAPKLEANTPSWHISYPWIQVSDFADWQTIAAGISKIWIAETDDSTIAELVKEIENLGPGLPRRIERAIQLVQDECRYLSVNLELGGQIPTSPGTVARRRYGDCKDLSFLLVTLLKKLGIRARPVLVNTFLRKSVRNFMPMPSLFNHVVVEFEVDGKQRWIDTTFKQQGGGAFNRFIPDYGCGLPVDASATGLVESPKLEISNLYDLHKHVLLDTKNGSSLMAVTLHVEGNQADLHRIQFKKFGLEEWSKQRLESMINRYRSAKRVGELKCQDDRDTNVFVLTEVFEIEFKLGKHANPKLRAFHLPGSWLNTILPMPPKGERHNPFLLPYPCAINYVVDVDNRGINRLRLSQPRTDISTDFAIVSRTDRVGFGHFTMRLALQTKAAAVTPELIEEHMDFVEKMANTCNRVLNLAPGYSRPISPSGFGELPTIIKPKPPFTPESKKPAEAISPVIRKYSFIDKIRRHWRIFWIVLVVLFWVIGSMLKGCSH